MKRTGIFFGTSFLFHLLWENLQAPLYQGYTSFGQHFWICLKAAAAGDMLFTLIMYITVALVQRNGVWITDRQTYRDPSTWILAALVGVLLAISFELWAVYVDHRWQYAPAMPLIPLLQIGITPVLQMILVPVLALFFSRSMLQSKEIA